MKRPDDDSLRDVESACEAIGRHLSSDAVDEIVFDAVRMRIMEIGEAVKNISATRLAAEPGIDWSQIAGMRDRLAHRYFDTEHGIVLRTARHDVPELLAAVRRLLA